MTIIDEGVLPIAIPRMWWGDGSAAAVYSVCTYTTHITINSHYKGVQDTFSCCSSSIAEDGIRSTHIHAHTYMRSERSRHTLSAPQPPR